MNDLVDRDRKLPANKAKLNKAKLHMDTHMHRYIDADSTLITSEETTKQHGQQVGTGTTPGLTYRIRGNC